MSTIKTPVKIDPANIKIAFFDVDGTLISAGDPNLSEATKSALLGLQAKGVMICLATGRPVLNLPRFEGINFDAHLCFNGSYCFSGDTVIFENPIPAAQVKTIIDNATRLNRPVSVAAIDEIGANGVDEDLKEYYSFAHLALNLSPDFQALSRKTIFQIMCRGIPEEYDALLQGAEGTAITAWWTKAVDIIPASSNKGVGVEKILAHFGFSPEQAIAFGDGHNDIEMLQTVGLGVAMGNAREEVKAAAHAVCPPVDADGLHAFCLAHGLI